MMKNNYIKQKRKDQNPVNHWKIRLIRMIEKIEKNPEFSSKIGVRNTSEFISSKQSKK